MTANAMQGDREMCLAAGMDDYVSKPIRIEELVRALAESAALTADAASSSLSADESSEEPGSLDASALQRLLSIVGGEFENLAELIDSFLDEAPQLLDQLEQFVQAGDAGGVRRVAHSLKSNGTDLGATAFAAQCKELEELGKSGTLNDAVERVARLRAEYRRVETALLAIRRNGMGD